MKKKKKAAATPEHSPAPKPLRFVVFLIPLFALALAIVVLRFWRVATGVTMNLSADRMSFYLSEQNTSWPILQFGDYEKFSIEGFHDITFKSAAIETLDGKEAGAVADVRMQPESSAISARAVFDCPNRQCSVAGLTVNARSRIDLATTGGATPHITISIEEPDLNLRISPRNQFTLGTSDTKIEGLSGTITDPSALRIRLADADQFVNIQGAERLILTLFIAPRMEKAVLADGPIGITSPDFSKLEEGQRRCSLIRECSFTYTSYPALGKTTVEPPDCIQLNGPFRIRNWQLEPDYTGIKVMLDGEAQSITKTPSLEDLRLSLFDKVYQNRTLSILITICAAAIPAAAGLYKFFKEVSA